jgi:hypothetical protein
MIVAPPMATVTTTQAVLTVDFLGTSMKCLLLAVLLALATTLSAQTLHDPMPLQGNQAQAIAATAAMNSSLGHSAGRYDSKASKNEAARRKSHRTQYSACNDRARQHAANRPLQKQHREQCRTAFLSQRATW